MGNLPDARTLNVVAGDPASAALLDELQDNIVGSNRPPIPRRIFPSFWFGGTSVCVVNPNGANSQLAWKLTTGNTYDAMIPFDSGDTLTGFSLDVYGDGAVDLAAGNASVLTRGSPNFAVDTVVGINPTLNNIPATWTTLVFTSSVGGAFPALLMGSTSYLELQLSPSGGTFLHVGYLTPIFRR